MARRNDLVSKGATIYYSGAYWFMFAERFVQVRSSRQYLSLMIPLPAPLSGREKWRLELEIFPIRSAVQILGYGWHHDGGGLGVSWEKTTVHHMPCLYLPREAVLRSARGGRQFFQTTPKWTTLPATSIDRQQVLSADWSPASRKVDRGPIIFNYRLCTYLSYILQLNPLQIRGLYELIRLDLNRLWCIRNPFKVTSNLIWVT